MVENTFTTQRLNHLRIVASVCHKMRLIEQIDAAVEDKERKISVG